MHILIYPEESQDPVLPSVRLKIPFMFTIVGVSGSIVVQYSRDKVLDPIVEVIVCFSVSDVEPKTKSKAIDDKNIDFMFQILNNI